MASPHGISVTALVDEVESLPSVAARVVTLTADPCCDMNELVRTITADAAMSLRFLALANSAAFSRGQEIRDLRGSLVRLGIARVRDLALLMGTHDLFPTAAGVPGLAAADVWRANLATACWSRLLGRGLPEYAQDAWLAGLLQGVGLGVLMRRAPENLAAAVASSRAEGRLLAEACRDHCGCHAWELGAAVCERWNLPALLRDVVAHQADLPGEPAPPPAAAPLVRVVRAARELVRAQGLGDTGEGAPAPSPEAAGGAAGWSEREVRDHGATVVGEVEGLVRSLQPTAASPPATDHARAGLARLGLAGFDDGLARRDLEQQLDTAREIQQRLLPAAWHVPGPWRVAAVNRPSRTVSGDIYDILPAAGDRTAVAVADVAGKGVAAAMLAANLQATLRALAPELPDAERLLARVNAQLAAATDAERFATFFLLLLPADGGEATWVSAGHVPPLVLRVDGSAAWLRPGGPPLGMLPDASYQAGRLRLATGDRLLACTDGLLETVDAAGREFGSEGLARAVAGATGPGAESTLAAVLEAVLEHADPATGPADDLTLLVVARGA